MRRLVDLLATEDVIALDVETALDFSSLCLVQIRTRERTWIIDALRVSDLTPLSAVFGNREIIKVIHNARFERRILAKEGLEIVPVFDTLEASRQAHGRDMFGGHSLGAVVARELELQLDKSADLQLDAPSSLSRAGRLRSGGRRGSDPPRPHAAGAPPVAGADQARAP